MENQAFHLSSVFMQTQTVLYFSAVPDAPQGLDIMERGRSSVELCWSKPLRDGGAHIDSYIIERSEGRYNIWTPVDEVSSIRFNYRITGLLESHRYSVRVAAVNSAGIGHWATVKVSKHTFCFT